MRIEQTFTVARAPETVFDDLTTAANLTDWQAAKVAVEPLDDGPPGLGSRFREHTRGPGGRTFEQLVEFAAFDR